MFNVWTTYFTASAHHGCGSCAQCRHTRVRSETTPILRSTMPICSELSAVMCSWFMLNLSRTCSNSCELKSGPPSDRMNCTACTCGEPCLSHLPILRRKLSITLGHSETDFRKYTQVNRVYSSMMRTKYWYPCVVATACLPLQSMSRRSRYLVAFE